MPRRVLLTACVLATFLCGGGAAGAETLPGPARCAVLPANNPWNERVDRLPVARDSSTLIQSIGLDAPLHAGFGSGKLDGSPFGIPYTIVSNRTPRVPVLLSPLYSGVSFHGLYPLAHNTAVQGSATATTGDRHAMIINQDTCRDYELYGAHRLPDGQWTAAAGVEFNLRSNRLRPPGWTSADGAGVPMFPGLVRYYEVRGGAIDHALWFTAAETRAAWIYPARHYDSTSADPSLPPMGTRVRLKANVQLNGLSRQARIIATAMKRYGMILIDNGESWYFGGAPDRHWNNVALQALSRFSGRDFEVVNTSSLPRPGL